MRIITRLVIFSLLATSLLAAEHKTHVFNLDDKTKETDPVVAALVDLIFTSRGYAIANAHESELDIAVICVILKHANVMAGYACTSTVFASDQVTGLQTWMPGACAMVVADEPKAVAKELFAAFTDGTNDADIERRENITIKRVLSLCVTWKEEEKYQ